MNNLLIEKVIKSNNDNCPDFYYDNPLLDRNVAKALSKSFVKILNFTKQNSKINSNLRNSILENIRKLCQIEPNEHNKVDENITQLITEFHCNISLDLSKSDAEGAANKALDSFLLKRIENSELTSNYDPETKPEVLQSLINLEEYTIVEKLENDIIHWNGKDNRYACILKELINRDDCLKTTNLLNTISIKIIPDIETLLIDLCTGLLINKDIDINNLLFTNTFLKQIVKISSSSPKCFQICYRILNFILITSGCNLTIRNFISLFVALVKTKCVIVPFVNMYQIHLQHIVLLLDLNYDDLSQCSGEIFNRNTIQYLRQLESDQESDLIMLLSHFPEWFDIYNKPQSSTDMLS